MDLGAYGQIDRLSELAKENGIHVDRLRGYRLMSEVKPYSEEELEGHLASMVGTYWWMYNDDVPEWRDHDRDDYIAGYRPEHTPKGRYWVEFVGEDAPGFYDTDPRYWKVKRVHRVSMFQRISMLKSRFNRQYRMYNQYAGQEGILYIHARIGGANWKELYSDEERGEREVHDGCWIEKQPWFICKCDDAFDPTYCDIYARLPEGYVIPYKEADRWTCGRMDRWRMWTGPGCPRRRG